MMKRIKYLLTLILLILVNPLLAQQESAFAGTWQGNLAVSADLVLIIQFTLEEQEDGSYSAMVNSTNNAVINDIAASAVTVDSNEITLEFNSLNGAFTGQLSDGVLMGEWSQFDESFPMSMTLLADNPFTELQIALLEGQWSGHLQAPADFDVVFRFERNEEGMLLGFLDVPAQGVSDFELADITIIDGEFSFNIPRIRGRYEAEFNDSGETLSGTFNQGREMPLTLVKGEYVAPTVTVFNLSAADEDRLLGTWSGELGPLTIILRFERNAAGEFSSVVDSPTQGANNLPVTEVTLLNNRFRIVLALGAEFSGEISGNTITGEWAQGGQTSPLIFSKD